LGACGAGMHSAWKKIQANRNCSCYGVVCYGKYLGPYVVTLLDWMLVFEWYTPRFVVKNRRRKYIMSLDYMLGCARKMDIILGFSS
jgi:hypothetical protein